MKHLGDITQLDGGTMPPVNVIIGGSPCQDLSVAGKQEGLAGTRSVLFLDQIRIVKQMREADIRNGRTGKDIRPRYMAWENVPGAFSSNKGADFGAVLTETVRIAEPKAPAVSMPKSGWPTAGSLVGMGNGGGRFSIAWRVFDAQFWGVPQRRRRIALIADFGGESAPEILFERESVRGDIAACGEPREAVTPVTQSSVRASGGNDPVAFHLTQTPVNGDVAPCLSSGNPNSDQCMCGVFQPTYCIQGNCIDRADTAGCNGRGWTEDVSYTLNTIDRPAVAYNFNGVVPPRITAAGFSYCQGQKAQGIAYETEKAPTLRAGTHDAAVHIAVDNHPQDSRVSFSKDNKVQTLSAQMGMGGGNTPMIYSIDRAAYNQRANAKYNMGIDENGSAFTVVAKGPGAVCISGDDVAGTLDVSYYKGCGSRGGIEREVVSDYGIVRRLTPLECERLQGFPDGWTDIGNWTDSKGKLHKGENNDNARYKALGNSIALPSWLWVLMRLSVGCGADTTMGSLFDGIGGFPLIWEYLNGRGSCLWASEIEEFAIAVTKRHFPEE